MRPFGRNLTLFLVLLMTGALLTGGFCLESAEARSMKGGRSFQMAPRSAPTQTVKPSTANQSGVGRGLAGGLIGGALGGLLLGSMFGMGGSGMGILPLLLLAGAAYFLYRRFAGSRSTGSQQPLPSLRSGGAPSPFGAAGGVSGAGGLSAQSEPTPEIGGNLLADGLAQIRQNDRHFDPNHFLEVASDVFFQVQAGWMRRDLESYRHLLGAELAAQYGEKFAEMRQLGQTNKLESIAVRNVAIVAAGSDGGEDFVTVLFTANLLDYTVDDSSGAIIDGSNTTPVKFREEWTWARPVGTQEWRLEGISEG